MSIRISQAELSAAEDFLVTYMAEAVPEADFSPGSAIRDLCIVPMAHVFAFLRNELASVKARQSLLSLKSLPAGEDVDEAVDAILSNYFITRKAGTASVVEATLYFSQRTSVVIPSTTQFYAPSGLVFTPYSTTALEVPAPQLAVRVLENGVTEYYTSVLLQCTTPGAAGNTSPFNVTAVDAFNAYFMYAETNGNSAGGQDQESTEDLLARAPLALTTRNLVNVRSISNFILENVPAVKAVSVIGAADPEMQRDLVTSENERVVLHTGGAVDVYVTVPRAPATQLLTVGGLFARPDQKITTLRDATADFIAADVRPQDILKITDGLTLPAAQTYIVSSVTQHELHVHPSVPFPEDTFLGSTYVTYSVGRYAPHYNNVVSARTTGQTTSTLASPGVSVLTGPVYRVSQIRYRINNVQYIIRLRSNKPPAEGEFQTVVPDPTTAQSALSATLIKTPGVPDGTVIEVLYDSVSGADLDLVQTILNDPSERVLGMSYLARAHHPVYVTLSLYYDVKLGESDPGPGAIATKAAELVEAAAIDQLSVGGLVADLTRAFPTLAKVMPPTISYSLIAPDGQELTYHTTDIVSVVPSEDAGARLVNAAELRSYGSLDLPTLLNACDIPYSPDMSTRAREQRQESDTHLRRFLHSLGVSDRTTRYLANADSFTVGRR